MTPWETLAPFVVFGVLFLDIAAVVILSKFRKKYAAELERLKGTHSIWVRISEFMSLLAVVLLLFKLQNSVMIIIVIGIFVLINVAIIVSFYDVYRAKKLSVKP